MATGIGTSGADATLVSAAQKLGQSYVPNDYSKVFAKQYEGIIASNKQKMKGALSRQRASQGLLSDIASKGAGAVDNYIKGKQEEQDFLDDARKENEKQINELNNNNTTEVAERAQENLEKGYGQTDLFKETGQNHLEKQANEYEQLMNTKLKSKEKRERMKFLEQNIMEFRNVLNDSGTEWSTKVQQWNTTADKNGSFKNMPAEQMLFSLAIDGNYTQEQLSDMGITRSYDDKNNAFYSYPPGLVDIKYGQIISPRTTYRGVGESQVENKVISEKDLLGLIKLKDQGTIDLANSIGSNGLQNVLEQKKILQGPRKGETYYDIENFEKIESKIEREYFDAFKESTNISHLANEDIEIGNQMMNFRKSYRESNELSRTVLANMGYSAGPSQSVQFLDADGDGVVGPKDRIDLIKKYGEDSNELKLHYKALDQILDKFTNPEDQSGKEELAMEMARYRTAQLKMEFNEQRIRANGGSPTDPLNPNN